MFKARSRTSRIFVHHLEFEGDAGVKEVEAAQRSKGALDCGYHYIIRKDGTVEHGRDERVVGFHTPGQNSESIGIAYIVEPGGEANDLQLGAGVLEVLMLKYPEAKL